VNPYQCFVVRSQDELPQNNKMISRNIQDFAPASKGSMAGRPFEKHYTRQDASMAQAGQAAAHQADERGLNANSHTTQVQHDGC
jgi:hypothetical protein